MAPATPGCHHCPAQPPGCLEWAHCTGDSSTQQGGCGRMGVADKHTQLQHGHRQGADRKRCSNMAHASCAGPAVNCLAASGHPPPWSPSEMVDGCRTAGGSSWHMCHMQPPRCALLLQSTHQPAGVCCGQAPASVRALPPLLLLLLPPRPGCPRKAEGSGHHFMSHATPPS
jgi:hypothetical protein